MIRRPPRSTQSRSSAASDVYKRQYQRRVHGDRLFKRYRRMRNLLVVIVCCLAVSGLTFDISSMDRLARMTSTSKLQQSGQKLKDYILNIDDLPRCFNAIKTIQVLSNESNFQNVSWAKRIELVGKLAMQTSQLSKDCKQSNGTVKVNKVYINVGLNMKCLSAMGDLMNFLQAREGGNDDKNSNPISYATDFAKTMYTVTSKVYGFCTLDVMDYNKVTKNGVINTDAIKQEQKKSAMSLKDLIGGRF
eukprot:TRINITY_DN154_c0_g2_i2.p1 TRINITY_DN154_c0_g2~~TRINITY_DN154_c0_g2_i2.p1  ORF type:complete len:247 (+),score=67.24 TRINITY_DN154_c0_g2_i2:70-810(+)